MTSRPKIYFAGPDVFDPGYARIKALIKDRCLVAGFEALCPADDEVIASAQICFHNVQLLDSADYVMANLRNFRGLEPDSGTVFEVGYAIAKGKRVWCYNVPKQNLIDQVPQGAVPGRDRDGFIIEDFGYARNLMIAQSCDLIEGDVSQCIAHASASLACRGVYAARR